jgi:VanZ family protein
MLTSNRHPYSNWVPVILWCVIIALESAIGSSANTGGILLHLVTWLIGPVDHAKFEVFHHIARKSGHFLGYGILGLLWFRAFAHTLNCATRVKCASLAIACTFAVASLDEWHQSFSPTRTATFRDVVLDTCGALVLVTLAMLTFARRWQRPAEEA